MTNWQPIETMPKIEWDLFLVCKAKSKSSHFMETATVFFEGGALFLDTGYRGGSWDNALPFEPTHWMPIPEIPKVED
jgi:hypothetical protein